jgi:hypothetical protein
VALNNTTKPFPFNILFTYTIPAFSRPYRIKKYIYMMALGLMDVKDELFLKLFL